MESGEIKMTKERLVEDSASFEEALDSVIVEMDADNIAPVYSSSFNDLFVPMTKVVSPLPIDLFADEPALDDDEVAGGF